MRDIPELTRRGVLHIDNGDETSIHVNVTAMDDLFIQCASSSQNHNDATENNNGNDSTSASTSSSSTNINIKDIRVGFPLPSNHFTTIQPGNDTPQIIQKPGLHGSTKSAAKRRLAALKRSFKKDKEDKKKTQTRNNNKSKSFKENDKTTLEPSTCSSMQKQSAAAANSEEDKVVSTSSQCSTASRGLNPDLLNGMVHKEKYQEYNVKHQQDRMKQELNGDTKEGRDALMELETFFSNKKTMLLQLQEDTDGTQDAATSTKEEKESFILPKQASFAGSQKARCCKYGYLSDDIRNRIPNVLRDVLGIQLSKDGQEEAKSLAFTKFNNEKDATRRKLYSHQATSIESSMNGIHTLVCTGTGSGKSLCFLIPILSDVMVCDLKQHDSSRNDSIAGGGILASCTALIMFPTKALAQDQLTKLLHIIKSHDQLGKCIRPGIIDGDTPHADRDAIAKNCNILLTNPDTLHAAILPGWKGIYRNWLAKLKYIVIDEVHTYEGSFGAHVSLVLSRLSRISFVAKCTTILQSHSSVNQHKKGPVFIGCSATIGHPEDHFRLLCPIPAHSPVRVVSSEEDGSPCASKHFFVWNPPLMDSSGNSIKKINISRKRDGDNEKGLFQKGDESFQSKRKRKRNMKQNDVEPLSDHMLIKRIHAADETARLLAHAVKSGIRCIAFCKTRMLAEWVYERCIACLQIDKETTSLTSKVEIYRGGYSASIRRNIECRLFRNELCGVVGTSALELGVDIGGIDLTLHCGYPGSICSLMQQAGRAGRGSSKNGSSFSIMICFSSPSEQVR